ncbi:hypothetical protein HK100_007090 [Physocladia obscura]|uniref:DNA-binding TFAR19-related protein n=1 Tax=Physocladia obscura TaxID=109957 RepID=A0AAD5T7D1_9FUNG|nr:hypothetical protein HK100_007090 [Physocladia obscura]
MEDDELAQIRVKRMAELRGATSGSTGGSGALPTGLVPGKAPGGGENDAEKLAQMEEIRRSMLVQLLDNGARERLSRISIVKPEKARAVEDLLIRMAQSGQLKGKINENMLIDLLEQLNEQQAAKVESKIKIARRTHDSDDDEDLLAGL